MSELQPCTYEFGEFRLDTAKRILVGRGGEVITLTPRLFDTLLYFVEHPGKVLEKDELMQAIWPHTVVEENNLNQTVSALRRLLGESRGENHYIKTVAGRGYYFVPDVKRAAVVESVGPSAEMKAAPRLPRRTDNRRSRLLLLVLGAVPLAVLGLGVYYLRSGTSTPITPADPVRSIAVLPFKPLVAENRDESLEMGMADTLIAKLSNIGEVAVRPLSAVRRYGGPEQDPVAAGAHLGVEAVLDGTIQRSDDSIRVTARLIRVRDGRQLWEGRFDARFSDIFTVQDSISESVAGSLKPRLTSAEETRLAKRYTENVQAYDLYVMGRYHALKRTLPETQKAISYFRQAITLDPSYALAYAGLADAHLSSIAADLAPTEFLPQARDAAQRAVEIDETLADAHAELGFIIFWWDWDWEASERQFKRALELDPNNANTHLFYAHLLSNTGRHEEALAEAKRARELDPLNLLINALEGQFLIHAGRTDEALARVQKTLEMDPNYYLGHLYASSAYIDIGMYSEAISEARKAKNVSGGIGTHSDGFLGYALAKAGREAEARSVLEGLLRSSAERHVSAYSFALVCNGLGRRDEALAWLERAYAQRVIGIVFLKVEHKWNNLRADPRFQDLVRRVGLPQ